jgi:hypothetical protein
VGGHRTARRLGGPPGGATGFNKADVAAAVVVQRPEARRIRIEAEDDLRLPALDRRGEAIAEQEGRRRGAAGAGRCAQPDLGRRLMVRS